jgi:hypothetical protein
VRRNPSLLAVALLITGITPFVSPAVAIPPPYIEYPDCGTPLVNSSNGAGAWCWTSGDTSTVGQPQGRTLTVATQTGLATATLTCYLNVGGTVSTTLTVAAPFTQSSYLDVTGTYYCELQTTAGYNNTTAIATNTTSSPNTITRSSTLTTANCSTSPGLCQQNNPSQPGGNNDNPFTTITATMVFADNGTTLTGYGVGTGFVPGRSYVSLVYLNPNVQTCSRFPAGQQALTSNIANADNDFASMYLGMWSVDNNGYGSFQVFPNKPTPVGGTRLGGFPAYGTVSVREILGGVLDGQTNPIVSNIQAGKDIPPNIFALRACGSLG